ncbi:MAG TPA: ferrous iron transport protein B [Bacillota bacterium]|nr:ferrous iron transport protein B [Bacillota bacterium]HPX68713.1 ferrous iron transport protein B [Bacillota bacterium]HQA64681.1 ferrous iron transport protein B [Bacillota bacterium]HQO42028.1 ferrous iron transport protein B [Bacillota bacterium]HQQ44022.1 ferrous iron transport protein B [Bacillota bacterium]
MSGCNNCNKNCIKDIKDKKLVLAGNPNSGKSVFFNHLTGIYVDVSNFPGTTVDISTGKYKGYTVADTPGVYGVSSFNEEETVARDVILEADIILNVVDSVHPGRDLFLTKQLIDMGKPVLVALNMIDELQKNGMDIDVKLLEELLGVPVFPTSAVKNIGVTDVLMSLEQARQGNRDPGLTEMMKQFGDTCSEAEALMILEDDEVVAARYGIETSGLRDEIYMERRRAVEEIVNKVLKETSKGASFGILLGRWMLRPVTGIPMLLLTLYAMYKIIGIFVAGTVVGFTEELIMEGMYKPFIISVLSLFISEGSFIGNMLIGEFGILTMVPVYIIGLLLPLIIGFYVLMAVLEDSGYLPRIAALADRMLISLGLNGKAIIPIILGFGCVTMATMTTRILGTKREKIIATVLLGLAIPCSAQLGVIMGLVSGLDVFYIITYITVITSIFVLAGTVLNKLMPGESSHLLIDLPTIRLPMPGNVVKKTFQKTVMFLKEAVPLFIYGALLISVLEQTGALSYIQQWMTPITEGLLKLPPETATAFIMGIIRRDFGAAGLTSIAMTQQQLLVSLIVMTLFVPCIAAIMVIFKERGTRDALAIWLGSFAAAFITGGIVAWLI